MNDVKSQRRSCQGFLHSCCGSSPHYHGEEIVMVSNKEIPVVISLDQRSARLMERVARALEANNRQEPMTINQPDWLQPITMDIKLPTPRMEKARLALEEVGESEHNKALYLKIVEAYGELEDDVDTCLFMINSLCTGRSIKYRIV